MFYGRVPDLMKYKLFESRKILASHVLCSLYDEEVYFCSTTVESSYICNIVPHRTYGFGC